MATELQSRRKAERAATIVDSRLQAEFDEYAAKVSEIKKHRSINQHDDSMLQAYGWFKQATEGDMDWRQEMRDFVHRAKWHHWLPKQGASKEDAMRRYIEEAKVILEEEDIRSQLRIRKAP